MEFQSSRKVVGGEGPLNITRSCIWQGEDRDSSDEEWETAYAALDPISQIGWGHRRTEVNAVGSHVVRDVFLAADELHEEAMSEMEGNTRMQEASRRDPIFSREACPSPSSEGAVQADDGMDVEVEGEYPNAGGVGTEVFTNEVCHTCQTPLCW